VADHLRTDLDQLLAQFIGQLLDKQMALLLNSRALRVCGQEPGSL